MYGILLVSENEGFRTMAPKFMPRIDHHADVHVANGPEAALLALGSDGTIDVVVFDHRLPGDVEGFMDMLGRSRVDRPLIVVSGGPESELLGTLVNGHAEGFVTRTGREPTEFFTELCDRCSSAADARGNRLEHRTNELGLQAMVQMSSMDPDDTHTLVDFTLERVIELTGSDIGYIARYDESNGDVEILAWSRKAMRICTTRYDTMRSNIKVAGVWAEPMRLGETVYIDDYERDSRISKKGVPIGHVRLRRLMMVPIRVDGRIVGTAGVGNKPSSYTRADDRLLKRVVEHMFSIMYRRDDVNASISDLRLVDRFLIDSPIGMVITDSDMNVVRINRIAEKILGAEGQPEMFRLDRIKTSQMSRIVALIMEVRASGSTQFARMRFTGDGFDRTYDVYAQMPREDPDRGFMVFFVDVTDLVVTEKDNERSENHIAVLEGPVLNTIKRACADLRPRLSASGDFQRLMNAVTFMDDYRLSRNRPEWVSMNEVVEKAMRSCALGDVELAVKTNDVEILADPSFFLVFKHLFLNSLEAGHGVSRIEVRCRISRGSMTISYHDDGSSIPDGIRLRMSELAETERFGLFLVRTLVESSGFALSLPPCEDGTLVEIEVPPESYMLR